MNDSYDISKNSKYSVQPIAGPTVGDLITYLQQFPKEWTIAVPDAKGGYREQTYLHHSNIASVLMSQGQEIEWD